jgi:hypothetical protein
MNVIEKELCDLITHVELSYWSQKAAGYKINSRELHVKKSLKKILVSSSKHVKKHLSKMRKVKVGFLRQWDGYAHTYMLATRTISACHKMSDRERLRKIFKWVRQEGGVARMNSNAKPLSDENNAIAKEKLVVIITTQENYKFDKEGNVASDQKAFAINYFGPSEQRQTFKQLLVHHGFQFSVPKAAEWRDSVLVVQTAFHNANLKGFCA